MRILRVITRLNIGGPARHAVILHRGLAERGHECLLATGEPEGPEGDFAAWEPVEAHPIRGLRRNAGLPDAIRATRTISALTHSFRPDIVHTHMAMAGACGRIAARASSATTVHTYHGHVHSGYFSRTRTKVNLAIERGLARRTDQLVAVSNAVRDELGELGISSRRPCRVIPIGLDLDQLFAVPVARQTRTVGIVARLVPIKDHTTLFEAFREVQNAKLVVAGDGELRGELESLAQRLGIADRVHFRGWVRDLPELYAELDLVVLSSRNEGTPVSIIEAMAAGRPVVATDVGGVRDIVPDDAGILVEAGRPDVLAEAIRRLLDHPDEAARMGVAARTAVGNRFESRRLVHDVEALYAELLSL